MFRIRSLFSKKQERVSTGRISKGRLFSVALLSAVLSVGFVSPGFQATTADAGAKRSGVKMGGGKRIKTRTLGSQSSGMRMGSRQMGKASASGSRGSRTYTTRKSVLDGGHQAKSGGKRRLGSHMAHGGSKGGNKLLNSNHNYNSNTNYNKNTNTNTNVNTNTNNVTVKNNIRLNIGNRQLATSRAGVGLSSSQRNSATFRQIAGGTRTVVTKRRLRGSGSHYGRGHGVATGFSAGGLVVIAGAGSQSSAQASAQVANNDCAYGTYCTIDLGGPKIITFNDVEDYYEEENIENLSDEELERRYGAK